MNRPVPRSIDEYLDELRSALAGADPALIQDALYDAEEYLRAESAANPETPEVELLARVATVYGMPQEVAAGYRATEVKVRAALQPPAPRRTASPSAAKRFFSIYSDPRAYSSLFFMLLSLFTGVAYFTFAVTGLSLSLGLAILIIGLPTFLVFIGMTRVISLGEGRLLEAVSGERMPTRPVHPGLPDGLGARILAMLRDVRTWTTLGYLVLMLPIGIAYFVIAVTGIALGVSLMLVPVVGIAQRSGWSLLGDGEWMTTTPAWLDTPIGWPFCVVFGVVVCTTLMHLARGVVSVHARAAKVLLVTPGA